MKYGSPRTGAAIKEGELKKIKTRITRAMSCTGFEPPTTTSGLSHKVMRRSEFCAPGGLHRYEILRTI
jgi:hypothetical protein